ncbi:MAG: hypothetical protein QM778_20090 [Myxococcales bacterium]
MRRALVFACITGLSAATWLGACGERAAEPEPSRATNAALPAAREGAKEPAPEPAQEGTPSDLRGPSADAGSDASKAAPSTPRAVQVTRKPRACVMAEQRVLRAGAARGVRERGALLVISDAEPKLELWRAQPGQELRPSAELELSSPARRAALLSAGKQVYVAWVDERAQLWLSVVEQQFSAPRRLAEGIDRRFTPALARNHQQLLLAFTRSVGEAMHVHLARVEGERSTVEDVTPEGHGASAPTFIVGAQPPALVVVDAHAGVSPLLELPFDGTGKLAPAVVRTPVSQPYAPPALAAMQLSKDRTVVAYTAIGRAAATAIGLVPLRAAEAPVALVPSYGYGELALGAAQQSGVSVFAVEAFRVDGKDSPRKVVVSVVDAAGAGEPLALGLDDASASSPSVAPGERAGEFELVYTTPKGLRSAALLCSP